MEDVHPGQPAPEPEMTPAERAEEMAVELAAKAVPPEPKKVSKEDMLKVEVLYLKITNCKMQEEVMKRDALKLQEDKAKYQQELVALSVEYGVKYGIELGKAQIMPDGTIIPTTNGN